MGSCYSTEALPDERDNSIYRRSPNCDNNNNNCKKKTVIPEYAPNYQSPTKVSIYHMRLICRSITTIMVIYLRFFDYQYNKSTLFFISKILR